MEIYLFIVGLLTLVVGVFTLVVSCSAKYYAQKAFSLSLFDKRYKLYNDFKILLNDILLNIGKNDPVKALEHLDKAKFLLWESQYIFGEDVSGLIKKIKEYIVGFKIYSEYYRKAEAGDCFLQEDLDLMNNYRDKCCQPLELLIAKLLDNNDLVNINSYFDKYLLDKDLRRPLKYSFKS